MTVKVGRICAISEAKCIYPVHFDTSEGRGNRYSASDKLLGPETMCQTVGLLLVAHCTFLPGLSLQLWIHLWGIDSALTQLLLSERAIAQALQVGTLVIETGAVLALISRRWRWAMGLGLMGLYVGILATFNFNFQYNALIVALFFLPTYVLLDWFYRFLKSGRRLTLRLRAESTTYRVLRILLSRFDILGVIELKPID